MSTQLWFTADTHFGHEKALEHRPFSSIGEMNECLIYNWNSVVGPKDQVWHLGDVQFRSHPIFRWMQHLIGDIWVLKGNHDSTRELWEAVRHGIIRHGGLRDVDGVKHWPLVKYLRHNRKKFWLSHYPHRSWQGSDREDNPTFHLFGHAHGDTLVPKGRLMDVGVDAVARFLSAQRDPQSTSRLITFNGLRQEDYRPISFDEVIAWLEGEGPTNQHDKRMVI